MEIISKIESVKQTQKLFGQLQDISYWARVSRKMLGTRFGSVGTGFLWF